MRLFVAGLGTETNSFADLPTRMADFEHYVMIRPGMAAAEPSEYTALLWAASQPMQGREVVAGTFANACPGGITERVTWERLRDEIIGQLREAGPVDAVALAMHGAMMAEGCEDCEGALLESVRDIVGPDVPIGVLLDLHCHLTPRMLRSATLIVTFKEYPHTDPLERAEELLALLQNTVAGHIHPRMSVFDCHMIDALHTTREPMRGFIDRIRELEQRPGILSISVIHSFPWGDLPELGAHILVITDDRPEEGLRLAATLGRELFSFRGRASAPGWSIEDAIDRAAAVTTPPPLVIADTADNPGGGAPGDSTYLLSAALARDLHKTCLGPLYDPEIVETAFSVGEGATIEGCLGGKLGAFSGAPVGFRGKVLCLRRSAWQAFAGRPAPMGDSAAIRINGIDVVVTAGRCQALSPELFRVVGIEPARARVVIVKSSHHFYDGFAPLAREVIYAEPPGLLNPRYLARAYTRLGARRLWPVHSIDEAELERQDLWTDVMADLAAASER